MRQMKLLSPSKSTSTVGLEIETGSVAAAEVRVNGSAQVAAHGVVPLAPGVFREGEIGDPEALAQALKELFSTHGLSRRVRLGIANQRVVVRSMRLPAISEGKELESAIRFQAQDHIPMPLAHAVLDWQVVGHAAGPNGQHLIDVVVVAARRDMLDGLIQAMRDAGLRPVGIDLSAFAMIRALAELDPNGAAPLITYEERMAQAAAGGGEAAGDFGPATLYCGFGDVLNLAVARGRNCLFARVSPFGIEGIAQQLAERRRLELVHARQWLAHVGLERPTDEIEGDPEIVAEARRVLIDGARKITDEVRLTLQYYGAQESVPAVQTVIACGAGVAVPGLVEQVQVELGIPVTVGTPAPLVTFDHATASRLALCYGLALEE
jgi:type IV pilus assembly protein PilM